MFNCGKDDKAVILWLVVSAIWSISTDMLLQDNRDTEEPILNNIVAYSTNTSGDLESVLNLFRKII